MKVKVGDKVAKGSVVVVVEGSAPAAAAAQAAAAAPRRPRRRHRRLPPPPAARPAPAAALEDANLKPGQLPHASPSVRKFARELGVNLSKVKGSGPRTASRPTTCAPSSSRRWPLRPPSPAVRPTAPRWASCRGPRSTSPSSARSKLPLSRIKKISGANLHRNWVMIPHVTNNDEADITDLEALRVTLNKENEKSGIKVTMLAFLIKAVVAALKKFPEFNASLDGDNLVLKQYYHIGFAADTPNGLVVPVIRDADKKGILQIAQEMTDLSKKARDGKISPADMQGGCFDLVAGRHRRHLVHAHHQCARSGHPGRVAFVAQAGLGRQAVRAAPDRAAVAVL